MPPVARRKPADPAKSERIELRTTARAKKLLARAAAVSDKNVTEFLLDAGLAAAEAALMDRRLFRLDEARWQEFNKALDRAPARKPALARLLAEKSVLE